MHVNQDGLSEYREDIGSEIVSKLDANGYLRIDGIAAKVGVLTYLKSDGTLQRELVTPEALFHEDSLSTLIGSPVTVEHPGMLTADNCAKYSRGSVPSAREDSGKLRVDVVVTGNDAIKSVQGGKRQLSPGYRAELEFTPGEYNGQRYDAIQKRRIYNHLAIVSSARGGAECRLNLDGLGYAVEVDHTHEVKHMATVKLKSGATVEVADASTAKALQDEINSLAERIDGMVAKTEFDALQGKFDAVDGELKKLKDAPVDKMDADEIGAYIETVEQAKKLKSGLEIKQDGKYLSATQVMAAALGIDAKDKSEEYIKGRFDSAVELSKTEDIKAQRQDGGDVKKKTITGLEKFKAEQLKRGA